jgi:drug/metabolite transporter (DMT)-like permease
MTDNTPDGKNLGSDMLLLLAALIWGLGFVAQRLGMEHMGPFTFSAARFAVGSLVLVPLALMPAREDAESSPVVSPTGAPSMGLLSGGILAGVALFAAASLQQVGLVYTTAARAAFITGIYVVLVPLFGLFMGVRTTRWAWAGAIIAVVGMYIMSSVNEGKTLLGDGLALVGACMWALHLLVLTRVAARNTRDSIRLALLQFAVCAALCAAVAIVVEPISMAGMRAARLSILYAGALSVGVAFTIQVVAMRRAHPGHAAIILSLEAVFAAIGGWFFLRETLTGRQFLGCGLMLAAMLLSQLSKRDGVIPRVRRAVDRRARVPSVNRT